jgi:4-amino-4-deoxy-L-arabinose transferase-like glycosyltransferase
MRTRIFILAALLTVLTGIRLFLAATIELSPQESYYYLWSQHPDFWYYDNGPGVAFAILAGTSAFGPTELGVRFLAPFFGLGTSLFVYLLARKLLRERTAFWAVLGLNFLPIFQLESVAISPESPALFFWAAALYTCWLALDRGADFSLFWPLTGMLTGLGFLCDCWNALQLFSLFFFLAVVPRHRSQLRRPGVYVCLLVFLLFLAPLILWNQQHEWIAFEHLREPAMLFAGLRPAPSGIATFLRGQMLLYSPLMLAAGLIALFVCLRRAFQNSKICFLYAFGWPALIQLVVLGFHPAEGSAWTGAAVLSLGILTAYFWSQFGAGNRLAGGFGIAALSLSCLLSAVMINTDLLRLLHVPFAYRADPTSGWRGWKTTAELVERYRKQFEAKLGAKVFLIGNSHQMSSALSFYLEDKQPERSGHPPVYIPESQDIQNEFSFWPRYDEFVEENTSAPKDTTFSEESGTNLFMDRTALYVTDEPEQAPPQNLQSAFTRWELVALYQINRHDMPLRQIRIFACYQYQTLPL